MQNAVAILNNPNFIALEFPTFKKFFASAADHVIPHARNNYHPHLLSHRMLGLLSLLLMSVKIVSVSLIAIAPVAPVSAATITTETVITLANSARAQNGLSELTPNGLLSRAAQNKANDMLGRQYFSHNTPDGETPWTFIKSTGYSYVTAGENLAIDFSEAESVQTAWMNSPGHRANILNAAFQEIGIGISKGVFDGHDTTIVVQMFGTPIAQPVTLQTEPTQVQTEASAQEVQTPAQVQPAQAQSAAPQQIATPVSVVTPETLDVKNIDVSLQEQELFVSVTASGSAVKVLAIYGNNSILLDPVDKNIWQGKIPLSKLSRYDSLAIQAHDIYGHMHQQSAAQFTEALNKVFKNSGEVEGASVSVLGSSIQPKVVEQKIFLIVMALLLAGLVLSIAIKRHVQHVSLIANTSFVAMLTAILMIV